MLSLIDTGPGPALPARFNMAEHVLGPSPLRPPDKTALSILAESGQEDWSYGRLLAAVLGCAQGFASRGLRPGDRVLLRMGNQVECAIAFLAALAQDLVPVLTSPLLTQAEITPMAAQVAPKLVVASPGVSLPHGLPVPLIADADIRAMQGLPPAGFRRGDPHRPGYIVFTSGTSGQPMPVLHAHRAILARQMMHHDWEDLQPSDRILHAGAFNWTYTLGTGLMDPWTLGASALIPRPGLAAADLPALMQRHRVTIFAAAPGVYRQMLRQPMPPLPDLRHGLSAGEKLPDPVREGWTDATGTPLCEALGLSELSTFVSESPRRPAPPGASGFAQTGRRIAALGPDGTPVPRGVPGELAADRRDPGLMLGYVGAEAATAARFRGDWFCTGDQVVIDAAGAVTYIGRTDDQMNPGGYRVSPLEVEAAMALCPGVEEVGVTEIEVRPGVTVIACFYTGTPLPDQVLADHASQTLARYKQPRLYRHLAALPRGANAKLNRRALRAMGTP